MANVTDVTESYIYKCKIFNWVPHQYSACLECARLSVLFRAKKEKGEEGEGGKREKKKSV